MKILLDECVDRRLGKELKPHDVTTVPEAGWAGTTNGELLTKAAEEFEIFITVDRNLSFQQNVSKFDIAVIVLRAPSNRLADLAPLAPAVLERLPQVKKGEIVFISE